MYMYYIYHKLLLIMHQSIPAVPSPPPPLLQGICPSCQAQGWEWLTALQTVPRGLITGRQYT